jgi:hypothetical protein
MLLWMRLRHIAGTYNANKKVTIKTYLNHRRRNRNGTI